MKKRDNASCREIKMLKTEPNVNKNTCEGQDHCPHSLFPQFLTNNRSDLLNTHHFCLIRGKFILERNRDRFKRVFISADDHILRVLVKLLNDGILNISSLDRRADIFSRKRLLKTIFLDLSARKINTIRLIFLLIDRKKTNCNNNNG